MFGGQSHQTVRSGRSRPGTHSAQRALSVSFRDTDARLPCPTNAGRYFQRPIGQKRRDCRRGHGLRSVAGRTRASAAVGASPGLIRTRPPEPPAVHCREPRSIRAPPPRQRPVRASRIPRGTHVRGPPPLPGRAPAGSPHLPRPRAPAPRAAPIPAAPRARLLPAAQPGPGAEFAAHRGRALLHGLLRVLHLEEVAVGREDGDGAVVAHAGERRGGAGKSAHSPPRGPRLPAPLGRAAPAPAPPTASAASGGRARAGRGGAGPNHRRPGAGDGAAPAGRARGWGSVPGRRRVGWASGTGGAGGGAAGGPQTAQRQRRGGRAHDGLPRAPTPSDCRE